MHEKSAAEVGFAINVNSGASFDVLREELGEDDLFGEKFGADGEMRLRWAAASRGKVKEIKEAEEVEETKSATHD